MLQHGNSKQCINSPTSNEQLLNSSNMEIPTDTPFIEQPLTINTTSNINAKDIDDITKEKLKGDLIGNTLYSSGFIVKTLLRFKDLNWDSDLENDLCFIWDATMEKDVCDYLFELKFPSIICDVIAKEQDNRLIEILIGILGNLYVQPESLQLQPDEYQVVLSYINSDDHLILLQVMRFIRAVAYNMKGKLDFISTDVMEKIEFILCNSINVDLLVKTLDATVKLLDDGKVDIKCVRLDLVQSCVDAVSTICTTEGFTEDSFNFTDNMIAAINHYVQFLVYFIEYYDRLIDQQSDVLVNYMDLICKVLHSYYNLSEFDFYLNDLVFIIDGLEYICPNLNIKDCKLYRMLVSVFSKVLQCDGVPDTFMVTYKNLLCYFISVQPINDLKYDDKDYKKVIFVIKEENFQSEYDHVKKLKTMYDYYL